jgi:hypothetical protein
LGQKRNLLSIIVTKKTVLLAINIYSIDLFRYGCIYLHPAIVKEDSVSRQSSIDLFRYGWIHLHTAIVKEDGVSRQYSVDLFWIWLDSLTNCNSKGGQCQPSSSTDMVGFTYRLQ